MVMPTLYIPHGGGPCFFMDWTIGPKDTWDGLARWLRRFPNKLPERPSAILIISAHWENHKPTLTTKENPNLIYDYHGFPRSTYKLKWPAQNNPALVARIQELLSEVDIDSEIHPKRGFDHGVFVPMKVSFPNADIPTTQLSLVKGLDPALHLEIGMALQPLREEGVLIIGSGMSYHNMKKFMTPAALQASKKFNNWLEYTVVLDQWERFEQLSNWERAPAARQCHPYAEHLLPLMIAAGAAGEDPGRKVFEDTVMGAVVSAIQFG